MCRNLISALKKPKFLNFIFIPLLFFSVYSSFSLGGDEKNPVILRAADDHELTYPTTQGLLKMAELIKKWSHGRISVKVYPSAQLGSERETIELTRKGIIDINRVNINPVTQIVPEFKILALPYIFRSAGHLHHVVDGEIGKELMEYMVSKGLIGLGFYDSGQRSFYNSIRPVRTAADLKGLRLRVQKAEIVKDMVRALGAVPIPMAFEEVYTGLKTGVLDGAENNFPSWVTKGHFEIARFYAADEHSRAPEIILFSKITWEKLSVQDRQIIRKAAAESIPYQRRLWSIMVKHSIEKAIAAGCIIATNVDKESFFNAMGPVYKKHARNLEQLAESIRNIK
ncbi:MAG: TRAP transporter substrate-binding protein [Spirochaetales bacterium]|nr:TRAP transporter substrate-binding protein [Spirochaetales bacterium]